MQQNGKAKVSRRVKMAQALELRAAGATYSQIATGLGVSKGAAWKLVAAGLEELIEKCVESAEKVKALELTRLDRYRLALDSKRSDPRACEVLLRISERVAKLHGLDKPIRAELTGADGQPIETAQGSSSIPNLTALSDDEIRQLATLHEKMKGKG